MRVRPHNSLFVRPPLGMILATVLLLLCGPAARGDSPKITRFTLDNGMRVVILYVAGQDQVGIYSYLPLGLAADAKGKMLYSHLIQHLTLSSGGQITDFTERNGETTAQGMHLDCVGKADRWKEGLELQARWLRGLSFSQQQWRGELPMLMSEIDNTLSQQFTHEWAVAGWNQAFRHGLNAVAVRGATQSARLRDLQTYRDRYLFQAKRTLLCVISGIEPQMLQPEIQKRFGSIKSAVAALPAETAKRPVKKELTATWDLKASHYIETYAVPQPDQKDYPALCVAAELLGQSFNADQGVKQWAGMVLCGADLNTPEGAYFYISASLTPGADPAKAKAQIAQQVDRLRKGAHNPRVAAVAARLSQQMRAPQDIAVALKSKPAWMTEGALVGNLGLQWGLLEFLYGDTLSAVADGLSKVSAADVVSAAAKYLSEDQRNALLLAPRS